MRILFIGPPLYGLLYPVISLAQAFRVNGHEVVVASAGKFTHKAADAGRVVFDAVEHEFSIRSEMTNHGTLNFKLSRISFTLDGVFKQPDYRIADTVLQLTSAKYAHRLPTRRFNKQPRNCP